MFAYLNFITVLCAQVLNTKSMETIKSITKKYKHNTKQIKYRRKLNLVLPYLHGGELTA